MINILVCVGSSCHLKGSYDVLNTFKRLIDENKLESKVLLKASFCLGKCTSGVTITLNGKYVEGVTKDNCEVMFKNLVLDVI